jgi:uncharacterized membrane protein
MCDVLGYIISALVMAACELIVWWGWEQKLTNVTIITLSLYVVVEWLTLLHVPEFLGSDLSWETGYPD